MMERFGTDRPDLRYGLELKDVADIAEQTEFKVFKQAKEPATGSEASACRAAAGITAGRTSMA